MSRVIPPWERVTPPNPPYAQQQPQTTQSQYTTQPFPGAAAPGNGAYGYRPSQTPPQNPYGLQPSQFLQEASAWGSAQESLALGAAAMMMGQSFASESAEFPKIPVFSGYLSGVQGYLNVSQQYVNERLLQLLFPFLRRFGQTSSEFGTSEAALRLTAEPWKLPDLYLPLMALMTYVILYASSRGEDFHPDDLYNTAAFAGLLVAVEVTLVRATAYLLGLASLGSIMESVAVAGYKFVHLSLILFFRLGISGLLYYVAFIYLSVAAAFATLNFLRQPLKAIHGHAGPVGNYVLIAVAGLQVPMLWLLQR